MRERYMNLIDMVSKMILDESDEVLRKDFEEIGNGGVEEFEKYRKEMYDEDSDWLVMFEDDFMKNVSKRIDEMCVEVKGKVG